jgi:3-hydroxyisobutyrate dehydrogenase-like beta-hydroxyacid dehydrogenase
MARLSVAALPQKAGKSPIVLAGERRSDRYLHAFSILGNCVRRRGLGAAKAVKIINNLLVGVVTAANAEAFARRRDGSRSRSARRLAATDARRRACSTATWALRR